MQRMRDWAMREQPELYERLSNGPVIFSAAVPEAMRRMIGHVCEWHGSIPGFVRALGVPHDIIEHLRSELLD
jgi:hypothetical protein